MVGGAKNTWPDHHEARVSGRGGNGLKYLSPYSSPAGFWVIG